MSLLPLLQSADQRRKNEGWPWEKGRGCGAQRVYIVLADLAKRRGSAPPSGPAIPDADALNPVRAAGSEGAVSGAPLTASSDTRKTHINLFNKNKYQYIHIYIIIIFFKKYKISCCG
jgi:hypothetical protein